MLKAEHSIGKSELVLHLERLFGSLDAGKGRGVRIHDASPSVARRVGVWWDGKSGAGSCEGNGCCKIPKREE